MNDADTPTAEPSPAIAPATGAHGDPAIPTDGDAGASVPDSPADSSTSAPLVPPHASRRATTRRRHGRVFTDPYEWLREKDSPEVRAHLEAENAWTAHQVAPLEPLRARLFAEYQHRTVETDLSVPERAGQWWYYTRTTEGHQYPAQMRCPVTSADEWTPPDIAPGVPAPGEQMLLDLDDRAAGHDFYSVGTFEVSANGDVLLYSEDLTGDERFTLRLRDLRTGTNLLDEVTGAAHGGVLGPTGRFVFYTTVDDAWRPDTVWRHEVGTPAGSDVAIHHEDDDRFWVGVGLTRSERLLLIESASKITSEVAVLDMADPTGTPHPVWERRDGVEYTVDHLPAKNGDALLVCHNENAPEFELVATALPGDGPTDPGSAVVVLPHDPNRRLEDIDVFDHFVAVSYRRDVLPRVGLIPTASVVPTLLSRLAANSSAPPLEPWPVTEIETATPLTSIALTANPDRAQPSLRLEQTSFLAPRQVLEHRVADRTTRVLKQQPVRNYNATHYEHHRVWARAEDGTDVPISLVWRADAITTGRPAPMVLSGYGAYETSIDPAFSTTRLSLLDRGVVYAVAHVRGGGELGRHWYEAGRLGAKRNSFTDFVACARHLIELGWTSPDRLVAEGGSAGGLLVGAAVNLAPELFAGVNAAVPFVDPLTSILDPSLPLTVIEWDEWGDPLHDPSVYDVMHSYSPYENVRDGVRYPRVLATTSLNDTRVLYVEPAKWIARLRDAGADALLRVEMEAGHAGASGRYGRWREIVFEDAWTLDVLGLA